MPKTEITWRRLGARERNLPRPWLYAIDGIRDKIEGIGEDVTDEQARKLADEIHKALERFRAEYNVPEPDEMEEASDYFHTCSMEEHGDTDLFNDAMGLLYDWADAERVLVR